MRKSCEPGPATTNESPSGRTSNLYRLSSCSARCSEDEPSQKKTRLVLFNQILLDLVDAPCRWASLAWTVRSLLAGPAYHCRAETDPKRTVIAVGAGSLAFATIPKAIWECRHLNTLIEPYGFRNGVEDNAHSGSDMAPGFLDQPRSDASSLRMFADG